MRDSGHLDTENLFIFRVIECRDGIISGNSWDFMDFWRILWNSLGFSPHASKDSLGILVLSTLERRLCWLRSVSPVICLPSAENPPGIPGIIPEIIPILPESSRIIENQQESSKNLQAYRTESEESADNPPGIPGIPQPPSK